MVPDHLFDDESQEFLPKLGVELGLGGQGAQPGDLLFLARGIGSRQVAARLVMSDRLRDPEPLGQHVNESCVDIVDALPIARENRIGAIARRKVDTVRHPRHAITLSALAKRAPLGERPPCHDR